MPKQALFTGLIVDEFDHPVTATRVGDEPFYVVDDAGFHRHIPSEEVDRQVLSDMLAAIEGHEDLVADQMGRMTGQDDPFSRAMLLKQLQQMDQQFEALLQVGLPEEARAYLGMMGFRIVINLHGEVLEVRQPGAISDEGGDE
ncbi:MAG TPA: hypothetical protein PKH92_11655, partial [Anaerolineaceae bacterium]|jgi:hypothetical protein|nr:hypothetical protein [Longilinea sp.]HNS38365.1 hypothetical protein [Anaerolineaceae bacterium]HOD05687.1 hypothetical protein [Anaerolineaceae bacterium]HQF64201.1 hypothetical protein [Anaerolineaceae bacterium]HQH87087.1 hypothetical protein [Anaerolineaceae bacterium]